MLEEHEHKDAIHDFDGILENRVSSPPVYFAVLFYGLIIWGVAFCAFYLLSGWSSDAEFQQKMAAYEEHFQEESPSDPAKPPAAKGTESVAATATSSEPAAETAATIYAERCAMCHGADAKGGIGPDLTAEEYVHGKSPEQVTKSIKNGVGSMPAFGNQLKEVEIKALVDYLLSL